MKIKSKNNSLHYSIILGRVLLVLFLSCNFYSYSQNNPSMRKKHVRHQLGVGPVLSFFKNNKNLTANTKAKTGYNAAYKIEILLKKQTSFITGIDYYSQGLTFKGYYSALGNTYLFDQTYPYTHEIRYNEIQLPLYFKLALNKEKDNFYTSYIFGGVGFRYLFNSYIIIVNDSTSTTPYDGKGSISFENFTISKNINANFQAGFGIQKNFRTTNKAMFLEFTYRYGLSRIYYEGHTNSNDLKIKDASLGITFGFRF